ncbi:YjaG family protein [Shewanella sp. NIFS-20-20]|uniref:YjaG family protein n=1 Tax=Shewanella sp. NIFS-20-20 TaxID=2853806 RepID=UPI001C4864B2|nr:YjaG family protein [Shewanella sp. NIFS-20-20]MBV7316733.1 YjaG family protein [Shewanella sp. NIFS-20-20]
MTNKVGFFKRLKALNSAQKQLFALALCQRMYPNYHLFSEVTEFGDAKVLDTALNLLWQSQYDKKLKLNIDLYIDRLENIVPDASNFDMYGVYPAQDAVSAVISLLSGIQCQDEEDMVNISKLSSSTVANYIEASISEEISENIKESALDELVFSHEVMVEERELQSNLLDIIEQEPFAKAEFIKALRKEIVQSGVSNIGICIDPDA